MFKKIKQKQDEAFDKLFKEAEENGINAKIMRKAMRLGVEDTLVNTAPILITTALFAIVVELAMREHH